MDMIDEDLEKDFRSVDFELRLRDSLRYGNGNVVPMLRNGHYCTQCEGQILDSSLIGPINVAIRDPEMIGPEGMEREFCSWECAADWFSVQAGRRPPYRRP
jgi:hypothetical protein